jgi:hypothetical protein
MTLRVKSGEQVYGGMLTHLNVEEQNDFWGKFSASGECNLYYSQDGQRHRQLHSRSHDPLNPRQCDTIFIGWKRPQEGWVKLNYDGAYKDS